jgi:hypothetical protein
MALVFYRGLTLPLWAMVFFAVALTASAPATPFVIAVLGIAVIIFAVGGMVPQLRTARSVVHVVTHGQRHRRSAALSSLAAWVRAHSTRRTRTPGTR